VTPPSSAFFVLLALLAIALAGLVRLKARPGPVRNYFTIFATSVAVWLASGFLLYSDIAPSHALLWARIAFAAAAIIILSLYHVLVLFPDLKSSPWGSWNNTIGAILAVLSLASPWLARNVTSSGTFQISVVYGPLFLPFSAYALTVVVLGVSALVTRYRRASGIRLLQIQYLLLGTVIPVVGVLITNVILPLVFKISTLAPYGRLLAMIFLAVTAHAIIRHGLMDIKLFVRKAVVYACAIAAGAGLFGGLLWVIGFASATNREQSAQESLLFAILVAVLFQPVKNAIERTFNRYFYRERHDYPRMLKDSSQRLSTMVDSQATATYLTDLVTIVFKADWVAVFVHDQSREAFVPLGVQSRRADAELEVISAASPLPSYLQEQDAQLLARDDAVERPSDTRITAATAQLRELQGEHAVAFWHLGRLWGFLVVGAKLSGDPYYSEDLDFLLTLGSQTAVAIENLQLHRRMEEERLRAERLGVIGTLASGIAHEIKNPLVAIRTFAELLPERFRDEEFHGEFSKVVIREIGRIDGLVIRLRELATRPVHRLTTLDIRPPIDETLALLRGQIEQKGVHVAVHYEDALPLIVGDINLLKQMFLNLCLNAIEAMEPGGEMRIRVSTRQALGGHRLVVFEVADTGSGIPDKIVREIFDPFFSTKAGGSGLGLAICRSIADAHGATILARNNSTPSGATFTVEFRAGDRPSSESSPFVHNAHATRA
jgi:signal transduction histidine kinase